MGDPMTIVAVIVLLGVLYVVVPVATDAYLRLRRPRQVVCPESGESAEIVLDATKAALTATVGAPELTVRCCAHWPQRGDCGQECLHSIDAAAPARAA